MAFDDPEYNVIGVALTYKMERTAWTGLTKDEVYRCHNSTRARPRRN
jgi:hypothetical protein